jgi:aldehyde:ferredoxin oxidoreductase
MKYGTCGNTAAFVDSGASPVKNWQLAGTEFFPTVKKIDGDKVIAYETKKYGCFGCPFRCGGITTVSSGK